MSNNNQSLKQQLLDAGVNLSDMVRDSISDENYPNVYEVLRKEERGMPITSASQVARLEKLRAYLTSVQDGTVQSVQPEEQEHDEQGRLIEVGNPDYIRRQTTRAVPKGKLLIRDPLRIKGQLCGPGSIINLTQAHGPLDAGTYIFLRALAKVEEPDVPIEIELYGGAGYLRAKTDPKSGFPTHYALHRTVHPDCFSRARAARPKQEETDDE